MSCLLNKIWEFFTGEQSKNGGTATPAELSAQHFAEYKCSTSDFDPRKARATVAFHSDSIAFFKRLSPTQQNDTHFVAQLKIQNDSNLVISYSVQTSASPSQFHITPNPHWICPHSVALVDLRTRKTRADDNNTEVRLADIVNELFVVFITPIFRADHLEPKNLDIIWRALGTELFPYDQAEQHIVDIKTTEHSDFLSITKLPYSIFDCSVQEIIFSLKQIWSVGKVVKDSEAPAVEEFKSLWRHRDDDNAANNDASAAECHSRELERSQVLCDLTVKDAQKKKIWIIAKIAIRKLSFIAFTVIVMAIIIVVNNEAKIN